MSCWRKECWQEKDRVHWLVLASQVVALLRSASENSQPAFVSEQASLTNAQVKSLDTQRTLLSPHSRGSEKWRKGQRNQICLTPGFPCKLINSELWSYWKVKFYPFQNLSWGWVALHSSLTKSWISELKKSSESFIHTSLLPSKAQIISTGDQCCLIISSDRKLTSHQHHSFYCCLAHTAYFSLCCS